MNLHYDFHLHSCLSPCGDEEMTPYNLVNMAALLGYQIIALTDHNTTGNCGSAIQVGKEAGITVVPGMELCTAEEIHVVCLFPGLEEATGFDEAVRAQMPPIKNKPHIFGEQVLMDAGDNRLGTEETLLVTASSITIDAVQDIVKSHDGFCYPAHVDRSSFSILSSLGAFPPELGFSCYELTLGGDAPQWENRHPLLRRMHRLRSSDAHRLEDMPDPLRAIDLPQNTAPALVACLRSLKLKQQ